MELRIINDSSATDQPTKTGSNTAGDGFAGLMMVQERREYVLARVAAGEDFKTIGYEIGVSRARANQIFHKALDIGRGYWHVWDQDSNRWHGEKRTRPYSARSFKEFQAEAPAEEKPDETR